MYSALFLFSAVSNNNIINNPPAESISKGMLQSSYRLVVYKFV